MNAQRAYDKRLDEMQAEADEFAQRLKTKRMKESAIETAFVKWCKANGYYTRKFSSPAHRGVPDRIVAKNGKVCFIEFKAPGNKPTALQLRELQELHHHGLQACWFDDAESAQSWCEGACADVKGFTFAFGEPLTYTKTSR